MAEPIPVESTVEDLEFLAETGVGITAAARRTGFASGEALDRWLRRHGHPGVVHRLMRHEPDPLVPSRKAS